MRGAVICGAILALLALARPQAAPGAGLRNVDDGWLAAPADQAAILTDAARRPAGPWCRVGQATLHGVADLPMLSLEAGLAAAGWNLSGGWHRTGGALLSVDRVRGRVVRAGTWQMGVCAVHVGTFVGGLPAASRWSVALVAGRLLEAGGARIRLTVDLPLARDDGGDLRALERLGRLVIARSDLVVAVAVDRRGDGVPFPGLELTLAPARRVAITMRVDGRSGSLGPGLVVATGPVLLRTLHSVHPALGVTHRFQIVAGALGAAAD